jgi:hypothetical protein
MGAEPQLEESMEEEQVRGALNAPLARVGSRRRKRGTRYLR